MISKVPATPKSNSRIDTERGTAAEFGPFRGQLSVGKPFALERVEWTGRVPFEIHEMHAKPDGFEFTFTQPADPRTAGDIASYTASAWTYIYQSSYGSPEVDKLTPTILATFISQFRGKLIPEAERGESLTVRAREEPKTEPPHKPQSNAVGQFSCTAPFAL